MPTDAAMFLMDYLSDPDVLMRVMEHRGIPYKQIGDHRYEYTLGDGSRLVDDDGDVFALEKEVSE